MNLKLHIINIFILILLIKGNLCEKDETCDDKDDYRILYDDHFLKEETSREFQFKLMEKLLNILKRIK
jgi:hypothetical protein